MQNEKVESKATRHPSAMHCCLVAGWFQFLLHVLFLLAVSVISIELHTQYFLYIHTYVFFFS